MQEQLRNGLNGRQWIEAVRGLEAESHEERGKAFGAILLGAEALAYDALRAPYDQRIDAAHEIADAVAEKLRSDPRARNALLHAEHPPSFARTLVVHAISEKYRSPKQRWRDSLVQLTDFQESYLQDSSVFQDPVDAADMITHLFAQLDDDDREILRMRFWDDMPFREIAEQLNISIAAASQRVYRLLARMREVATEAQA